MNIDPTDSKGQFYDRGSQYRTGIFYYSLEQKGSATSHLNSLQNSKIFPMAIDVPLYPAKEFYSAKEYHQNYHVKNYKAYCRYKERSGRSAFIKKYWDNRAFLPLP